MITDFDTWVLDVGYDRIFRMLEYRRPNDWTPYEIKNCFSDESRFVDNHYQIVKIKEVIELPDKDLLIGFVNIEFISEFDNEKDVPIFYKKLSEIELSYFPGDDKEAEEWDCH